MGNNSFSPFSRARRAKDEGRLVVGGRGRLRALIAPALALALVVGGAPAMALADDGGADQADAGTAAPAAEQSAEPTAAAPAEDPAQAPGEIVAAEQPPADPSPPASAVNAAPQARLAAPQASGSPSPTPTPSGQAKVTLKKEVINDDGGKAVSSDWTLQVSQDGETWQTLPQNVATPLAFGTWYLRETGGPTGYELVDLTCDNYHFDSEEMWITLQAGDDNTCTFTNDDQKSWFDLGLDKTHGELPANGGVEAGSLFDWIITVTNHGPAESTPAVVSDDIPDALTVLGVDTTAGTASFAGNHVEAQLPALEADGVAVVTVHVQVNPDPDPEPAEFAPPGTTPPAIEALAEDFVNTACVEAEGETDASEQHANCDDDTVPRKAVVARVWVSCINDAPFLMYEVKTTGNLDGLPITLTWTPLTGTGVTPAQVSMTVQPNVVTRLDWPGVKWNAEGVSYDWPGWRPIQPSDLGANGLPLPGLEVYGDSVRDTSEPDEAWRQPTLVTFSVNPQFSATAVYPPATAQCAVPAGVELAATGGGDDPGVLLALASMTLFGGAVLFSWGRRRRSA